MLLEGLKVERLLHMLHDPHSLHGYIDEALAVLESAKKAAEAEMDAAIEATPPPRRTSSRLKKSNTQAPRRSHRQRGKQRRPKRTRRPPI